MVNMASNVPPPPGANGPYTALPSNAAAVSAPALPNHAGHYADIQTLMQNLDLLSGWLQQNREDFDGLREALRHVEGMGGRLHTTTQHLENGVEGEDADQCECWPVIFLRILAVNNTSYSGTNYLATPK